MRASGTKVGVGAMWIACFLGGCGTESPGAGDGSQVVLCEGEKCDDTTLSPPPVLQPISLAEIGSCRGVLDTTSSDPFFQIDSVVCRFDATRLRGIEIRTIYVTASPRGEPGANSTAFEAAQLDGREVTIERVPGNDGYPLQIDVTVVFALPADATGTLGDVRPRNTRSYYFGSRLTLESRASAGTRGDMRVSLPFDLRPVALWPDADLQTTWAAGESIVMQTRITYGFDVVSGELNVGGPTPVSRIELDRRVVVRTSLAPTLAPLTTDVVYLPVPRGVELGDAGPALEITSLGSSSATPTRTLLPMSGYYVIAPNGAATLTAADQLPALIDPATPDPTEPPPPPDPTDPPPPPDPTEPPPPPVEPPPPPPDPCAGTCTAEQACVAGRCIDLTRQTQSPSCYAPTATCDANENQDCAADHACVMGYCRRLTCQMQSTSCYAPTATCDADDDGDCAEGHACAAGLCRRLTCQTQSTSCYAPTATCDATDDGDCGEGHACVAGLCRRLTCQTQSSSCYSPTATCEADDDTDCDAGHACVGGLCRRLTCQTQSTSCYPATASCDEGQDSDCAADHTCTSGVCRRMTCR